MFVAGSPSIKMNLLCNPFTISNSSDHIHLDSNLSHTNLIITNTSFIKSSEPNSTISKVFLPKIEWIEVLQKKLLYCFIPKNSCTLIKKLLWAIIHNETILDGSVHGKITHYFPINAKYVRNKLLYDIEWKSLIVLRDPLERLVSAYNDKCSSYSREWKMHCNCNWKWCNFTEFVNKIIYEINHGMIDSIDPHFRPQYTFCGLDKEGILKYFDYIIYYDRSAFSTDLSKFIHHLHVDDIIDETLLTRFSRHSSKVPQTTLNQKIDFYARYYDKNLAMKALKMFEIDYNNLKFPMPEWLEFIS